ncbi:hypothetical protein O59_001896 [Cellvibrio sp. BR]|nr:hypothetical protein O59_001896 [Cellvibrio sp. BR]
MHLLNSVLLKAQDNHDMARLPGAMSLVLRVTPDNQIQ